MSNVLLYADTFEHSRLLPDEKEPVRSDEMLFLQPCTVRELYIVDGGAVMNLPNTPAFQGYAHGRSAPLPMRRLMTCVFAVDCFRCVSCLQNERSAIVCG
jgi:hypothetical protein